MVQPRIFISFLFLIPICFFSGPTSPSSIAFEDHLIARYSFNGCDAKDDTQMGSDGILSGGMRCWCGVDEEGLFLDGQDDYVTFTGRVNDYFTTSDFTVSFYFKPKEFSVHSYSILSKRAACNEENMLDILLNTHHQQMNVAFHETTSKAFNGLQPHLENSGWHHFALVRDGAWASTYINGHRTNESRRCSGVDITNEALLSIANSPCQKNGDIRPFSGIIDELRVYDIALTKDEVYQLFRLFPIEDAEEDCFL